MAADLDEGPIIEQAVERIDHTTMPDQMVAIDVIWKASPWPVQLVIVLERRVLMNGVKTVVFR